MSMNNANTWKTKACHIEKNEQRRFEAAKLNVKS